MIKDYEECAGCHKVQNCNIKPKYFDKECPCSTCIVKMKCTEAKMDWRVGCKKKYHYLLWAIMFDSNDDYTREKAKREYFNDSRTV